MRAPTRARRFDALTSAGHIDELAIKTQIEVDLRGVIASPTKVFVQASGPVLPHPNPSIGEFPRTGNLFSREPDQILHATIRTAAYNAQRNNIRYQQVDPAKLGR